MTLRQTDGTTSRVEINGKTQHMPKVLSRWRNAQRAHNTHAPTPDCANACLDIDIFMYTNAYDSAVDAVLSMPHGPEVRLQSLRQVQLQG